MCVTYSEFMLKYSNVLNGEREREREREREVIFTLCGKCKLSCVINIFFEKYPDS